MFEPGDVVECVDAGPLRIGPPYRGQPSGLTHGALYTVEAFYARGSPGRGPGRRWRLDCVDLREVRHPNPLSPYDANRFRLIKRRDPDLIGRLIGAPAPLQSEPV